MANSIGRGRLSIRVNDQWMSLGEVIGMKVEAKSNDAANVVGGSLDGASIPEGTRDGQQLTWDKQAHRWRG